MLGKSQLITNGKEHSTTASAGAQLDEPAPPHPYEMSEGGGNQDGGHFVQICDRSDVSDQCAGGMSALQRTQSVGEKVGLDALTTLLEAQMLIAQGLGECFENSILPATFTAWLEGFKPEEEAVLSKVDKLKGERTSRQSHESIARLTELRRTYNDAVGVLSQKLRNSEEPADNQHECADWQSKSRTR